MVPRRLTVALSLHLPRAALLLCGAATSYWLGSRFGDYLCSLELAVTFEVVSVRQATSKYSPVVNRLRMMSKPNRMGATVITRMIQKDWPDRVIKVQRR